VHDPVLAYPDFSQLFILTTDASKVAVAATLSHVQDRVKRPIAYASRQMNKADESYSALETEMIALVRNNSNSIFVVGNLWSGQITPH